MRYVYVCKIYIERKDCIIIRTHIYIHIKSANSSLYCLANRDIYIKTWRTQYTHAAAQSLVFSPFLFTFCQCAFFLSLSLDRFSFILCSLLFCSIRIFVFFFQSSHSTLFTDLYYLCCFLMAAENSIYIFVCFSDRSRNQCSKSSYCIIVQYRAAIFL